MQLNPVRFSLLYTQVDSVKWNFGDPPAGENNISTLPAPIHTYPAAGTYNATAVIYTRCFADTAYTEVVITDKPAVKIPAGVKDSTLCLGNSMLVDATVPFATNYLWSNGKTEPVQEFDSQGSYWVKVSNECNTDTKTFLVTIDSCNCKIFVPTAFTPNMDQLNDIFRPIVDCNGFSQASNYLFRVFNRWGAVVFSSTKAGEGWNGKLNNEPLETGSYKWMLQYINPNNQKPEKQYGTVMLLR